MFWQMVSILVFLSLAGGCGFLLYRKKLGSASFASVIIVISALVYGSCFVDRVSSIALGKGYEVLMREIKQDAYAQLEQVRAVSENLVEFQTLTTLTHNQLSRENVKNMVQLREDLLKSLDDLNSDPTFVADVEEQINIQIYRGLKARITARLGAGGNTGFNNEYNKMITKELVDHEALRQLFNKYDEEKYDLQQYNAMIEDLEFFGRHNTLPQIK